MSALPFPSLRTPTSVRVAIADRSDNKSQLVEVLRALGWTYVEDVEEGTVLVTDHVLHLKYQIAQLLRIPVVHPNWLLACHSQRAFLPFGQFPLPAFAGCTIAVTGLSPSMRHEVQRLVAVNGGTYSANFMKQCSHLIVHNVASPKYAYAHEWGVSCVSLQWFFDCIHQQSCLEETSYPPEANNLHQLHTPPLPQSGFPASLSFATALPDPSLFPSFPTTPRTSPTSSLASIRRNLEGQFGIDPQFIDPMKRLLQCCEEAMAVVDKFDQFHPAPSVGPS